MFETESETEKPLDNEEPSKDSSDPVAASSSSPVAHLPPESHSAPTAKAKLSSGNLSDISSESAPNRISAGEGTRDQAQQPTLDNQFHDENDEDDDDESLENNGQMVHQVRGTGLSNQFFGAGGSSQNFGGQGFGAGGSSQNLGQGFGGGGQGFGAGGSSQNLGQGFPNAVFNQDLGAGGSNQGFGGQGFWRWWFQAKPWLRFSRSCIQPRHLVRMLWIWIWALLSLIHATQLCSIISVNLLMTEVILSTNLVDRSTSRMHQSKIFFCAIQQMKVGDGMLLNNFFWEKLLGMLLRKNQLTSASSSSSSFSSSSSSLPKFVPAAFSNVGMSFGAGGSSQSQGFRMGLGAGGSSQGQGVAMGSGAGGSSQGLGYGMGFGIGGSSQSHRVGLGGY
jgi:uncharacterized membrane protein YgcG